MKDVYPPSSPDVPETLMNNRELSEAIKSTFSFFETATNDSIRQLFLEHLNNLLELQYERAATLITELTK